MDTVSTDTILSDFIAGDENAFAVLFRKYYSAICYYIFKMIDNRQAAEDIASVCFQKLWIVRSQINDSKNIQAYLYTIARNQTINWTKKHKSIKDKQNQIFYLSDKFQEDSTENIIRAETMRLVMEALEMLPGQCKKIMKMYYEDGKNSREIAEELNLSIGTIKTQKARGIELLKKKLGHSIMIFLI